MEVNNNNINEFSVGLHTDASPQNQPKGTQRFALNTVNETDKGDEFYRSNEEGNEPCIAFPEDFIPIGKVYISDNETVIFLVSKDNMISEFGILKNNCTYEQHVNDEDSDEEDKLGFTVEHQIQATYRLRRGCERTIYFTDDNRKPRYYNFDKPADFKNDNGTWAGKKFNLFKEYNKIPEFRNIEVLDSGGVQEPGSVNISIRYLDEGLNPSEWILTSEIINIYNDLSTEDFLDIQGSINSESDYLAFPTTSKSIKVEFDNLDENYAFYQLAFIHATTGSGFVSDVKVTDVIPTSKDFFVYTGENAATTGTQEEILFFNNIIDKANSIEQIENRLILVNTEGKQTNFCKLQRYASRIKADVVTRKIYTNQIDDPRNTKNPTVHFGDMITGGTGYMPGEIYSFGVVYVFEDGTLSPVFHIPGKNPDVDPGMIFSPGEDTYPMSNNNESINNRYIDNDNCDTNTYWGLDSEGITLQNKPVRHHRFPLRSELNLPLVQEEVDMGTGEQVFPYYYVQLTGDGTITLPVVCPDPPGACVPVSAPPFQARVTYTVDGVENTLVVSIDPSLIASNPAHIIASSNFYTSNDIVIVKIEEADENGVVTDVTVGVSPKGLTYVATPLNSTQTTEGKVYSTEILGIKFSGVDLPSLNDTNGEKIVGYYIVRNERIDNEKTILDSAVLVPTFENNKYISHGLLAPNVADTSKINKKLFGVIHPEHKFNKKEYNSFDYIKQEGNFDIIGSKYSKTSYNDVYDGTSYDSEIHKSGNDDGSVSDGFSLTLIMRDNYLSYKIKTFFNIIKANVKEMFYLNALESRDINDGANTAYNISVDNRIGIIQFENEEVDPLDNRLPYVVIGRYILDSYSNFRTLPYYKDSLNMEKFNTMTNVGTATIFNGDTYVCPMRYTNSIFWDNRIADRAGKTSVWNYIIGGILIIVGTVLAFFTAGATTLVIGAGISIIGGGALFISSGIKRDAMVKAYGEEYKKGLRETVLDDWVDAFYNYKDNPFTQSFGFAGNGQNGRSGPSDDEIQWIGDTLTDLWFESTINISLRNKMISDAPTFLDAPGIIESGNDSPINTQEYFGKYYTSSSPSRYPVSKQDYHMNKKLLVYNSERKDTREYIGAALGEYYEVNPDYHRKNKQKIFYHLPLEYDCCSECQEDFPHRWHWSEQSFQEELTDNYRVFLPNNYKDLEGETGEATNVFKIGNNLFIHTQEALWEIPRSYQERVTDQIVSFIGTGSYGEVPARKVIDDDTGSSAGSQHKWALIKTPSGVFFPSENQRKIYQFDGQQLKPISSVGNGNWFQNNMELLTNKQYYDSTGRTYPYNNNPSNPFGTGYISTYDTTKERIIFTKKDYLFNNPGDNNDFEICINNGQVIYFNDFNQTIEDQKEDDWIYTGIENCRMKFEKTILSTRTETREIRTVINVPNDADVIVHLDMSGSFNPTSRAQIKAATIDWYTNFQIENPEWVGNIYFSQQDPYESQRCWKILKFITDGSNITDVDDVPVLVATISKNIIAVSFVNENKIGDFPPNVCYHGDLVNPLEDGASDFYDDYDEFIPLYNSLIGLGGSFIALNYPIVYTSGPVASTRGFLQHVLAAVKGVSYTFPEVEALEVNPFIDAPTWDILKLSLQGVNPYPDDGLENYGWEVKSNRGWNGTGDVITSEQFQIDMDEFLEGKTTVIIETIEVEVNFEETIFMYIDGVVIENPIEANNSWTMSYSLKQGSWISWHSYLPNFYLNIPEKFYSWIYGNDNLWKHNKKGSYQIFYGNLHPFILEYVSLSNPLVTRIWEYLMMLVEVKQFNSVYNEYTDINDIFFNKLIAYNSRQCSGSLNIKVKDADQDSEDYLYEQINNLDNDEIIVDRNERNWSINNLRDIRTNYAEPIFKSDLFSLQTEYFIDKVLNNSSIDYNKDWTELESFRDKYLVIRLIFDNFARSESESDGDIKMIMNFSAENETQSFR